MNNKCIFLKQKLNRKLECKKLKKEIKIINCSNCKYREFKTQICSIKLNKTQSSKNISLKSNDNQIGKSPVIGGQLKRKPDSMKKKSNKLAKLERERTSLFTDNKDKCMFCPSTYHLTWHEIYRGRNRQNSMKYKLCLRMCDRCHDKYQEDIEFNNHWHKKGQLAFITNYPNLKFEDVFKINYLVSSDKS